MSDRKPALPTKPSQIKSSKPALPKKPSLAKLKYTSSAAASTPSPSKPASKRPSSGAKPALPSKPTHLKRISTGGSANPFTNSQPSSPAGNGKFKGKQGTSQTSLTKSSGFIKASKSVDLPSKSSSATPGKVGAKSKIIAQWPPSTPDSSAASSTTTTPSGSSKSLKERLSVFESGGVNPFESQPSSPEKPQRVSIRNPFARATNTTDAVNDNNNKSSSSTGSTKALRPPSSDPTNSTIATSSDTSGSAPSPRTLRKSPQVLRKSPQILRKSPQVLRKPESSPATLKPTNPFKTTTSNSTKGVTGKGVDTLTSDGCNDAQSPSADSTQPMVDAHNATEHDTYIEHMTDDNNAHTQSDEEPQDDYIDLNVEELAVTDATHVETGDDNADNSNMNAEKSIAAGRDGDAEQDEEEEYDTLCVVRAVYAIAPETDGEMQLLEGDLLDVYNQDDADWWFGQNQRSGQQAHFPSNYVEPVDESSSDPAPASIAQACNDGEAVYGNLSPAAANLAATKPLPDQPQLATTTPAVTADAGTDMGVMAGRSAHGYTGEAIYGNVESATAIQEPAQGEAIYGNLDTVGTPRKIVVRTAGDEFEEDESEDIVYARALYDYHKTSDSELSFGAGNVIELISCDTEDPWWSGVQGENEGWFPSEFVEIVAEVDAKADPEQDPEAARTRVKRRHCIDEMLQTEVDYLDNLKMMVESYVIPMRRRIGQPFEEATVDTIFGNIEQLHDLATRFHADLVKAVNTDSVGQCFEEHAEDFKVYSRYCSNHPKACEELARVLKEDTQIKAFFAACQLLVEKAITLEGFLLKPVQRICQYPLQLRELIKLTDDGHADHYALTQALARMQEMALEINEDKRHKEEIVRLQERFEGWTGRDITDYSTKLIYQGPLSKISGNHMQERQFFLFDNMFVYCKKTLKSLVVKGKIFTENMTVMDLADGEFRHGRTAITNAIRIKNESKNKWYVLAAKDPAEKERWLNAFLQERTDAERAVLTGTSLVNNAVEEDDDTPNRKKGKDRKKRR
eukprot:TRINITY_DN7063_c0_g1_i1.p1 TRINITY_DN7063_c0_g1~~TRINITY_DN7063_c0_g1_i1.p1  ORF type:complete len:1022 (+),score=306.94 TRINITY_DN7063_c0_g1_i1:61-3126(+)